MSSQNSWPFSACSANAGARRRFERKRAFPRPPCPPSATMKRAPSTSRSHTTEPLRSRTTVPTGTGTTRSLPRAPCFLIPTRARHRWRDGRGGHGNPAATPRSPRPRANVATVTAVAPIGATTVHMGLPAPRHSPGSPITSARMQLGLVNEAGHSRPAYESRADSRTQRSESARSLLLRRHVELGAEHIEGVSSVGSAYEVLATVVDGASAECSYAACGRRRAIREHSLTRPHCHGYGICVSGDRIAPESSIVTTGWMPKGLPATASPGCVVKTSWAGTPTATANCRWGRSTCLPCRSP